MKKVYIGRWDLLPEEWEGINGLYDKSVDEIAKEIGREIEVAGDDDRLIGEYSLEEFEETFNQTLDNKHISSEHYFIKFL